MSHYFTPEPSSLLPTAPPPLTIRHTPPELELPVEEPPSSPPTTITEQDPDRSFLLLLMVLLVRNQAPLELILAIGYLAM